MSRKDSRAPLNAKQDDALTEFENFKKKFLLANKHITKLNSTLSVRIEELQAEISTLYVKNLRLRASEISLAVQLKKTRERLKKILADADVATPDLSKLLPELLSTMASIPTLVLKPKPVPKARRAVLDSKSPLKPHLSGAPDVPGIHKDDTPALSKLDASEHGTHVVVASPTHLQEKEKLMSSSFPLPPRSGSPPPHTSHYVDLVEREWSSKRKSSLGQSELFSVKEDVGSPVGPELAEDDEGNQDDEKFGPRSGSIGELDQARKERKPTKSPPEESERMSRSARHSVQGNQENVPDMSTDAPGRTVSPGSSRFTEEKIDVLLPWLNGFDCTTKHQSLAALHISGTCSWLYGTVEYMSWWSGNRPFLWLQGKAGSGKSVLAYSVIEHLKRLQEPVVYFYCDHRDDKFASAVQVMYSLLYQMLLHFRDNPSGTLADNGSLIDLLLEQRASGLPTDEEQLASLVSRAARGFHRCPLIVIDALDECRDVERLSDALGTWSSWKRTRILVTSRPLQSIKEKLFDVGPRSVITWDNFEKRASPDLLKFIETELNARNWFGAEDPVFKGWLAPLLLEKSEGMFPWVKDQVDSLTRCSDDSKILDILGSPAPVELYDEILLDINRQKKSMKFVRRVLSWLVSALRPIRLHELVEALVIDLDCQTMEPEQLRDVIKVTDVSTSTPGSQTPGFEIGSALLHVLGSLVTHNEATDSIAFVHSSVKTYLTDPSTNSQYQIDLRDSHEELAATCMCYLSLCLRGGLISINNQPPFRITGAFSSDVPQAGLPHNTGSPLLEYVLTKSFHHLLYLLPGNETILGDISALESDLQQNPDGWESLRKMASHARPWPSMKHDFTVYTLIAFSPDWLLRAFLDREPLPRRLRCRNGANPLIYAARFDATDQARTLLFRGADLHGPGWVVDDSCQVLPLVAAIQGQTSEMLELFLEWQAPVPADVFTDLASHPSSFTLRITRLLLQTNEFVEYLGRHRERRFSLHALISDKSSLDDEEDLVAIAWRLAQVGCVLDSGGETAIRLASAKGYLSLVEYLVSIGVPLPDDILFFVVERGSWDARTARMICYLLEQGIDIDSRYPADTGNTVLHSAIKIAAHRLQSSSDPDTGTDGDNLTDIVTTLVGLGCNTQLRNAENYTPLHLAVLGGHVSVVKYLVQVTTALPEDLSAVVSLAPSSVRDEIKGILMNNG